MAHFVHVFVAAAILTVVVRIELGVMAVVFGPQTAHSFLIGVEHLAIGF